MNTRENQRQAALERMVEFTLSEGLGAATLRPLAKAAGTSDRMLLYYFSDKNEILSAILSKIAERMLDRLDEALPDKKPRTFASLLDNVWSMLASDELRSLMPLWLELAAGAARGQQPHLAIAGQIGDGLREWVMGRLEVETEGQRSSRAALFMTMIEGMYVLQAIGRPNFASAAARQFKSESNRR